MPIARPPEPEPEPIPPPVPLAEPTPEPPPTVPIPPPIPAHRVINARGELSGGAAFGGYAVQRARLEADGVEFLADGRVDLDRYLWLPDDRS